MALVAVEPTLAYSRESRDEDDLGDDKFGDDRFMYGLTMRAFVWYLARDVLAEGGVLRLDLMVELREGAHFLLAWFPWLLRSLLQEWRRERDREDEEEDREAALFADLRVGFVGLVLVFAKKPSSTCLA